MSHKYKTTTLAYSNSTYFISHGFLASLDLTNIVWSMYVV